MARTSLSLAPLARHLRSDGHRVTLTGYLAALEQFDAVCGRVRGQLEGLSATREPYAVIGHSSPFGGDLNDGTVAVAETLVDPNDDPILVPARHTFMMNHSDVRKAVRHALMELRS